MSSHVVCCVVDCGVWVLVVLCHNTIKVFCERAAATSIQGHIIVHLRSSVHLVGVYLLFMGPSDLAHDLAVQTEAATRHTLTLSAPISRSRGETERERVCECYSTICAWPHATPKSDRIHQSSQSGSHEARNASGPVRRCPPPSPPHRHGSGRTCFCDISCSRQANPAAYLHSTARSASPTCGSSASCSSSSLARA